MSYILERAKPVVGTKTLFGSVHFWVEGDSEKPKKRKKSAKTRERISIGDVLARPPGTDGRSFSMPYEEFFNLVYYVLKNEDLQSDDPRIIFLQTLKRAQIVPGWNALNVGKRSRRIQIPDFSSHGES